ncbi:MAG: serine/threonine-protein kinase, partial [Myxococcota bacterium]
MTEGQADDGLHAGRKVTPSLELVRLLGRGGMGSVWVARDAKLDREVAVKFISSSADSEETLKRFEREARIAARVDHPHVVQVFDFGLLEERVPYLVMELLKGESLDDRLDRDGRLPVSACAMLVEQLAQALTAIHKKGVVHRDIKPGNVFLLESGYEVFAKVVDFGIARPDTGQKIAGDTMTMTGVLIGTPYYMSPEQLFEAAPATSMADNWALSVVAYESVTGHLPFDAETVAALGRVLAKGTFKHPSEHDASLPPDLDRFFLEAFAPRPEDRPPTPEALAAAFVAAASGEIPSARPSGRSLQPSSSADTEVRGGDPAASRATPRRARRSSRRANRGVGPTASRLGKYQLVAELGHGGMADVYLAVTADDEFDVKKLTVVKRLRPQLAEDEDFVDMIVDEARLAARLNHPNVVQTLEAGRDGKHYFIAMEYLEGQPLHRILSRAHRRDGGMSKPLAYFVLSEMLAGLHHAHELKDYDGSPLSVVHRDVSPHNIFVTYDGAVKVMDFGIAKAARRATYTSTGVVKGKVSYMAPEQARGGDIDRRVDLFAAGILLWEVEAGRRLWGDCNDVAVMNRLTDGDYEPSPQAVAPNADARIDEVCRRALAFAPEGRFTSAADMQAALDAILDAGERPTRRELGAYVAALFENDRRTLATQVEQQMRRLSEHGATEELQSLDLSTPPSVSSLRRDVALAGEDGAALAATAIDGANRRDQDSVDPRPGGRDKRLGVAAAAVVVLGGIAWAASRPSEAEAPSDTSEAAASSPDERAAATSAEARTSAEPPVAPAPPPATTVPEATPVAASSVPTPPTRPVVVAPRPPPAAVPTSKPP